MRCSIPHPEPVEGSLTAYAAELPALIAMALFVAVAMTWLEALS